MIPTMRVGDKVKEPRPLFTKKSAIEIDIGGRGQLGDLHFSNNTVVKGDMYFETRTAQ